MNQVTMRIDPDGSATVVPALGYLLWYCPKFISLGESWAHSSTNRVDLIWKQDQRQAHLYKSPYCKPATVPFHVTADGVR